MAGRKQLGGCGEGVRMLKRGLMEQKPKER